MKRSGPLKRRTPLKRSTPLARVSSKKAGIALPDQLAESAIARKALARVLQPYARNTQRAYKAAWAKWHAWSAAHELAPVPIEPMQLVAYLEELAQSHEPDTVRAALAAISAIDTAARGLRGDKGVQPIRSNAVVKQWLKSWGREVAGRGKRKARPIDTTELITISRAMDGTPPRGYSIAAGHLLALRDRALILMGWFAALRRSELADLKRRDVRESALGLEITITRSKTDQEGAGVVVALHRQHAEICPVLAWKAWQAARVAYELEPNDGDAAFVIVEHSAELGGPLSHKTIERIVKKRSAAVGLVSTPHSLRGGFATTAADHGKQDRDIQAHGRWKSQQVMRGYVQRANAWTNNPTHGLGLLPEKKSDENEPVPEL